MLLVVLLVTLGLLTALVYLSLPDEPGFPLDDAWIHQVYARNLGTRGEMAFTVGRPSTGSTAPAWTALLSLGYVLNIPPTCWAYLWGTIFAIAAAALAAVLSYRYFGRAEAMLFVASISLIEWHMAWASLSGMEISLFTFLSLFFFYLLDRRSHPVWIGLIAGVSFLVRPEAVLLVTVYGLWLLFRWREERLQILLTGGMFSVVFLLPVVPMLVFNLLHGGRLFPNTVYAKYLQYGHPWSLLKTLNYLSDVLQFFALGPLLLLAPLVVLAVCRVLRGRVCQMIFPLAWIASVVGLYSIALPSLYHHGRYLMPLIPWIVILGIEGMYVAIGRFRGMRLLWKGYKLALLGMVIALWINHASTYGLQVDLLRENHFRNADWLNAHAAADAILATHDIGILGYRTEREIVDLAGLITPEVVPFLHDQKALSRFVQREGADYLVVFAGYHDELIEELDGRLVFVPDSPRLQDLGYAPFEIYWIGSQ
jgi:hypothetical protein